MAHVSFCWCKFSCILTEMSRYLQLEPQQLHVYMYCWRLRGGGVPSNQSNPPSLWACNLCFEYSSKVEWLLNGTIQRSNVCILCSNLRCSTMTVHLTVKHLSYSVSQKHPLCSFLTFFPNGWELIINFLHTYYTLLYTLDYKFLFNYLHSPTLTKLCHTKWDQPLNFYISL